MSIGLCFWVLMLIWLVFGVYVSWPADNSPAGFKVKVMGGNLLLFVLLFLLGWAEFGFMIKGPGGP